MALRARERVAGFAEAALPTEAKMKDERCEEDLRGVQERVLQSGMLSKSASYRVIVSGHMGAAEFDKLIAKLEMDRDILTEPEPEPPATDAT
jgi:hypothetical protein